MIIVQEHRFRLLPVPYSNLVTASWKFYSNKNVTNQDTFKHNGTNIRYVDLVKLDLDVV